MDAEIGWLTMPEFIANAPAEIKPGEPITVENRCKNLFSAGTGIVFHENGEYFVTVTDNRIIVEEYRLRNSARASKEDQQ